MGFDAKGIRLFVWKIIRFSGSCSYKFVRKFPVLSGFVIFAFSVYIYFPSFFYILMYSSPILICTAISIRFYWKTKHPEVQVVKKKDSEERSSADANRSKEEKPSADANRSKEEEPSPAVDRSKVPSLRHQKSVRRNARKEVPQWDRDDSPPMLLSRSLYDILPGKSSLLEENSKLALDVNGSSNMELGESSSRIEARNDQAPNDAYSLFANETLKPRSVSGDSFGGQSGKSLDEGGGAGGVVDAVRLEDRNKAVEWTKEDEKNLMDLGTERNKRLESLMAKRRARNMFKMAVEKSLKDKGINPHSQIAPILIVKNNILGASNNANDDGLQMPGSAPSVLLPTQNPFDLPYDPFEEKPNLTAGSVLQQFMPANQKETLFCRHESFCHGPLFTFDTTPDPSDQFNPYYGAEKRLVGGPAVDKFRRSPDDEGGLLRHNSMGFGSEIDVIELEESNRNEAMNSPGEKVEKITETANDTTEIGENNENPRDLSGSEVRMDIDSIKNTGSCYSPSSSDDSELGLDQTTRPLSLCTSQVRKALNLSIPPKGRTLSKLPFDYSPSPRRAEFNLFYNTHRRLGHARDCSIASDLQVEVSEVGSTTLSTDGTVSPVEGDATYDGDVERDINSDSEELWPGSFNLTREANREKLRELDDIIEEDSVELQLSGLNKKPEEPIASIFPSEQEAVQNLNNTSSLSSRLDTTEDGASYPANINRETHEDVIRRGEEDNGFKSPNVSDKLSPEDLGKTMQLTDKSVVRPPPEPGFQKPEQLSDPQQKPIEELNIICNVKPITQGDANTLESKSSETRDDGTQAFIKPAALEEMGKPDEAINLDSCKDHKIETSYESTRAMGLQKEMEESQGSKYIEEDTHNLTKHDTVDAPNAFQSRDESPKNIGQDTPNLTEYSIGKDTQRLATEQTYLSSRASPRSVLPQNIVLERKPVSNVEQERQTDRPQSVMKDIERYSSASNQPQESSTFNMPPISQQLVENSIDHSSNCNPGTSEGSNTTTKKNPNGSPVHNMNELVPEGTHVKEDSSIKSSQDESKTSTSSMDEKELSKPSGESNPDFNEHLRGSKKQTELNSGTDPSKSKEGNTKSDDPNTMVTETVIPLEGTHGKEDSSIKSSEDESKTSMGSKDAKEPSNPSGESNPDFNEHLGGSKEQTQHNSVTDPSISKAGNAKSDDPNTMVTETVVPLEGTHGKEDSSVKSSEDESKTSTRSKDVKEPLKSSDESYPDSNKHLGGSKKLTEHNYGTDPSEPEKGNAKSDGPKIMVTEKSEEEVDRICNVNEPLTKKMTNKESSNHFLDGEGESEISSRQKAIMEPSRTSGATTAGSIKDTEHESGTLAKTDASAGLSTSEGGSNSLKDIKNSGDVQNLSSQESVTGALESKDDNPKAIGESISGVDNAATSVDHTTAMEESELKESEVKAVNTKENDSNEVAR